MHNPYVTEHPFIQHKLTHARQRKTAAAHFRSLIEEITSLMMFEITSDLQLTDVSLEGPVEHTHGRVIAGKKMVLVPILRAGLGMLPPAIHLAPRARVGHLGYYRDRKSLQPVEYYRKIPHDTGGRTFIVLDPTLATGGTAVAAVNALKEAGAPSVKLMSIIAAPEGLKTFLRCHPEVQVYLAAVDRGLSKEGMIVPGFGDAGDRIFGTAEPG